MRLVSLNAWGGQVWPALGDWAAGIGADILCLQEVTRAPVPSPDTLRYADAFRDLSQRADLLADISKRLPGFQPFFAPAARGTMDDARGRAVPSEHGIAFWLRRDLALVELYQGFVHGRFRGDGWGAEPVPRAIQVARVSTGPATFQVAHLHGLRDPAGKHDTAARAAQAEAIAEAITRLRREGEPLILAGDLNLLPDSATFPRLADIGLTDLVKAVLGVDT